jgi:ABC-type nitrate/sulfonate/bicarbonate transport system substrate-binding protein
MRQIGRRILALGLLAVLACAAPAAPSSPQAGTGAGAPPTSAPAGPTAPEPVTLSYAHPVISSLYWHIFVGQDKGLFADEGITLEPVFVAGGVPAITQGTVGGAYQVASISAEAGIIAVEQGAPLVYVGGEAHKAVFSIVVQPEITSWADFKGQERVIGAASVRGGTSTVFRSILRAQGLQDGPDYSFVAAGSTSERVAALRNKAIAAGLMAQPQDFMMQDAGFRSLGLTSDFLPRYAIGEVAVRRDWAQANEDVVVRYLRANTRALQWLYDPANRAEALAILEKYTKTEPEYAARSYDLLIDRLQMFARNGELDPAAFEGTMKVLVDEGDLPAPAPPVSKYLDMHYWEKAIADVGRR